MDTDASQITDTQQEIRPETPSGTITATANVNQGSDSGMNMNLCGRHRVTRV